MAVASDSFTLFMNDMIPFLRKIEEIFAIVGILYIGKVGLATLCDITVGIRAHFYSRLWRKKFVERFGKWAVVTGCTDGIGKCYAEELAKEGLNLILISRSMEKLTKVAGDLGSKYSIMTEVVQVDFSEGKPIYKEIEAALKGKEIGMLINNVGVMLCHPMYFSTVSEADIWSHVNVNMASVCSMTRLILPQMLSRGRGAIVNVASIAASGPLPLMGIYSASKAFVDNFSQSLEWECRGKGVTVQTVIPSYVSTKMVGFSSWLTTPSFIVPTAEVFVSNAIRTIGYTKRTTGYWHHGIQSWFVEKVLSNWLFMFMMGSVNILFAKEVKMKNR